MVQLDTFEDFYEKAVALYRSDPSRVSFFHTGSVVFIYIYIYIYLFIFFSPTPHPSAHPNKRI